MTNEDAKVDKAIVDLILPKAYQLMDRLIDHIGFNAVPKSLRIECQKLLPDKYSNSFQSKKGTHESK